MTFTVPNKALTYPFQSRVFQSDWDILARAAGGRYGVVNGCEATESVSPDMNVSIAAGQVVVDGAQIDVAGQVVGFEDADPLNPRFDLIVAYDDGDCAALTGTADAAPFPVSPTADSSALHVVYIPALKTTIEQAQIVDKTVPVPSPIAPGVWTRLSVTADLTRASNASMTIDPTLQLTMVAGTTYRIRFHVQFYGVVSNSGGLRFGLVGPAAPTLLHGSYIAFANQFSGGANQFFVANLNNPSLSYGGSFTIPPFITIAGDIIVHNGANSGAFGLGWAQSSAVANGMTRAKGSWMEYEAV